MGKSSGGKNKKVCEGRSEKRRNIRNEEIELYAALANKKTFCILGLCLKFVFSKAEQAKFRGLAKLSFQNQLVS